MPPQSCFAMAQERYPKALWIQGNGSDLTAWTPAAMVLNRRHK
jgi:hypothetical protein